MQSQKDDGSGRTVRGTRRGEAMNRHHARRLGPIASILAALSLNACAIQPYAGIGIAGPGYGYGPFRIGTGVHIGVALPPIWPPPR
jgi:hypothetical protein